MYQRMEVIGWVGKAPKLSETKGGSQMCTFEVATTDSWLTDTGKKRKETTWHNIVAFNRLAEVCKEYVGKGSLVFCEGTISKNKFLDDKGFKRLNVQVRIRRILFLSKEADIFGGEESDNEPLGVGMER